MKKSEQYRKAQEAVLKDGTLLQHVKLEILKTLMADEDLALFQEKRAEAEKEEEANRWLLCTR